MFKQIKLTYDSYHQNPAIQLTFDNTGKEITSNIKAVQKTSNQLVGYGVKKVPTAPMLNLPAEESLEQHIQTIIKQLREVLEERPIVTRRFVINRLGRDCEYDLRYAIQYTAYIFRSGPWKDALVKFGLDPRVNSECRQYQTLNFKVVIRDSTNVWSDSRVKYLRSLKGKPDTVDKMSHLFDGLKVMADGKVWQICDITDPLLREIIDSDPPVETCDVSLTR